MTTTQLTKKIQHLEEQLTILRRYVTTLPAISDRREKVVFETRGTLRPAVAQRMLASIKRSRQKADR